MALRIDELEKRAELARIAGRHFCAPEERESGGWGAAISSVFEDEDLKLWVMDDEYAMVVNYCPFCGFKSKLS